jgi:hypothetical protein
MCQVLSLLACSGGVVARLRRARKGVWCQTGAQRLFGTTPPEASAAGASTRV